MRSTFLSFFLPLTLIACLLWSSEAFAVDETCVVQTQTGSSVGATTDAYRVLQGTILFKCTAASDDASMTYTFAANSEVTNLLDGRTPLWGLSYDGTGTDPTAASDLSIYDGDGRYFLRVAGNGLNVVDNGTDHSFYFEGPDGNSGYQAFKGSASLSFAWANNAVNSGVNYLLVGVTGERNVK